MPRVRVRLRTAQVRLSFDGSRETFERQIEPLLMGLARKGRRPTVSVTPQAPPVETVEESPAPDPGPGYTPPSASFGTFRRQLDPGQDGTSQRIAAYAFFLWNYERKEIFQDDEILGCFAADERDAPGDLGGLYEDLEGRRILERAGDDAWRLTPRGLSRVRRNLR